MTIEEIQYSFKVDIRQRNQKRYICYLKWLLIEQEINKGLNFMDIAEDINIHYSQVCKNTKKLESVAKGDIFLKVKQCFETKDAKLFSTFETYEHKTQAEKKSVKKWTVSEIISTLRKDNSHYLWNKIINEFTNSDYKEMRKLLAVLVLGVLFVGCDKKCDDLEDAATEQYQKSLVYCGGSVPAIKEVTRQYNEKMNNIRKDCK